ncbi:isochorismatase family protein [Brevibacillus reuszeri]|uniref:isochorismatase family protein n=1 Tax=Brevibacillus reuszeri TaxID=54915 RepID=UPI0035E3DA85
MKNYRLANTCIEATTRFGMELGYHITLVKDATTAFTKEALHVTHEIKALHLPMLYSQQRTSCQNIRIKNLLLRE